MQRLAMYQILSERVAGWTRGAEAEALMHIAYGLPTGASIVEIGVFLGSGTILLAGARKLRRSGMVHCVDPFDASGDDVSVPEYARILDEDTGRTQVQRVRDNLRMAGLANWITVHEGRAEVVAASWGGAIDMMFMDGDQSPAGVESAYTSWAEWLKPHAVLALHNSIAGQYAHGHDGHYRLRERLVDSGEYVLTQEVGTTSFLRKIPQHARDHFPNNTVD